MSGKGSCRRPQKVDAETFAANWERVFGKGTKPTVPDDLPGSSSTAEQGALTASVVSSNLTSPATYVDNATGAEVS